MLLQTRYGRLTFNVFMPPKSGSQTARTSNLNKINFHIQNFTFEIRAIFSYIANGHIFYIICFGMDVSVIVARFQVATGICFLSRASKETVRPIVPPIQQMCESLVEDVKGHGCQFSHSPRSTVEH